MYLDFNETVLLYNQFKSDSESYIEKKCSNFALFPIKNQYGKLIAILDFFL